MFNKQLIPNHVAIVLYPLLIAIAVFTVIGIGYLAYKAVAIFIKTKGF